MKILYVCTHNACRSILFEAITRDLANGAIEVASAGSQARGVVHQQTLHQLEKRGYSTENLHSKGFADVVDFNPDVVITVCDHAVQEPCPVWLGTALKAHWGLPDPTGQSSTGMMDEMFNKVIITIERRVKQLLAAPEQNRQTLQLPELLRHIGNEQLPGS